MRYATIQHLNKPVSRLIQGTLGLAHMAEDESRALLDRVYELGCTTFDTAPVYGRGESELRLGRWLEERKLRREVVLISKGCHPDESGPRMTVDHLNDDLLSSLERLNVERVDLYLLHRDDPALPVSVMLDALEEHRQAGRIVAYGASNWTHQRIELANDYARRVGARGFVASSPAFSLVEAQRTWPGCLTLSSPAADEALSWYRRHEFPLFAWSPLASGFLSGDLPLEPPADEGWLQTRAREFYANDANYARLSRLQQLASQRKMTTAQLAIAYVLNQGEHFHAVVGCSSPDEFAELAAAHDAQLTPRDIAWLEHG